MGAETLRVAGDNGCSSLELSCTFCPCPPVPFRRGLRLPDWELQKPVQLRLGSPGSGSLGPERLHKWHPERDSGRVSKAGVRWAA